jgi:hypothetical protein
MSRQFGILSRLSMPTSLSVSSRSLRLSASILFSIIFFCGYTFALEKLSLCSLSKRKHNLDALIFRFIGVLNPASPSWKMLIFVFLLAMLGASQCLVVATLINTVLLLAAPLLPAWWVKVSIYLQLKRLLPVTFYNLLPKFVNNI